MQLDEERKNLLEEPCEYGTKERNGGNVRRPASAWKKSLLLEKDTADINASREKHQQARGNRYSRKTLAKMRAYRGAEKSWGKKGGGKSTVLQRDGGRGCPGRRTV